MRALKEGVDEINIFYGYGDSSRDVKIDVMNGGRVAEQWQAGDGRWYAQIRFPQSLRKHERHTIRLGYQLPEQAPECPPYCTVTAAELIRNLVIEVDFGTRNAVPESIKSAYWVSDVSSIRCIDGALHADKNGVVRYRNRRTKPGHRYGIVWDWGDPRSATAPAQEGTGVASRNA